MGTRLILDIALVPVPKARPRVTWVGRRRAFTPNPTAAAERALAGAVRTALGAGHTAMIGPIRLGVVVIRPVPATLPREQREHRRPSQRPDLDNFLKLALDSLTVAGVWLDDSQITELVATKVYAFDRAPGWVITVEEIAPSSGVGASVSANRNGGSVSPLTRQVAPALSENPS